MLKNGHSFSPSHKNSNQPEVTLTYYLNVRTQSFHGSERALFSAHLQDVSLKEDWPRGEGAGIPTKRGQPCWAGGYCCFLLIICMMLGDQGILFLAFLILSCLCSFVTSSSSGKAIFLQTSGLVAYGELLPHHLEKFFHLIPQHVLREVTLSPFSRLGD